MLHRQQNSLLTPRQSLAARPVQLLVAEVIDLPTGGAKLVIPLQQRRLARWFFRMPPDAKRTYELDALGLLVWNSCDGRNSVLRIIRLLARRYHLTVREAQVSTLSFLQTLARKGLIGLQVKH